ncbi:MAG: tRNA (adenosine(37)-N6)-dimethylallyltransferase MiaA [Alphaproteobacteria bacterium]
MRSDNKPSTSIWPDKPQSWSELFVLIAGPTASGKSALAVALAERADGVVINADSMQLYKDLHVLTARPDAADEARVPHRLYGVLDGATRASVASWLEMLAEVVRDVRDAGKLPIIVGGTGMYINAAINGIASIPDVPVPIHQDAVDRLAQIGGAAFRTELAEHDPVMAQRLFDGDSQRLVRAMGVVKATGRPLSEWQTDPHQGQLAGTPFSLAVMPPRAELYQRIDARFDQMITQGALAEVEALGARQLDEGLPVMKALGVRELLSHLRGEMPLEQASELAKRDSRRYAKRQMTWIRNNFNPNYLAEEKYSERLLQRIFANLLKTY